MIIDSILSWVIIIFILWLNIGFLGRCLLKYYFVTRFYLNGSLTKEEAWTSGSEVIGLVTTIGGPIGVIATLISIRVYDNMGSKGKPFKKWGFLL